MNFDYEFSKSNDYQLFTIKITIIETECKGTNLFETNVPCLARAFCSQFRIFARPNWIEYE